MQHELELKGINAYYLYNCLTFKTTEEEAAYYCNYKGLVFKSQDALNANRELSLELEVMARGNPTFPEGSGSSM